MCKNLGMRLHKGGLFSGAYGICIYTYTHVCNESPQLDSLVWDLLMLAQIIHCLSHQLRSQTLLETKLATPVLMAHVYCLTYVIV